MNYREIGPSRVSGDALNKANLVTGNLSQNYSPALQIKPSKKLMWGWKINSIPFETDAKERIFKMSLPASPRRSVQETFRQRKVP